MISLVVSLSLCVVSIWLPGSPFDPNVLFTSNNSSIQSSVIQLEDKCAMEEGIDFTSVGVLLAGIMAARFGLWIADLSVTQIQQENVEKGERGVIGGIQSSMNQIMDVAMFVLVLILPRPE